MSYINKELLLSSISVDEFKLHLLNPIILLKEIIEKDDLETWKLLYEELTTTLQFLGIKIKINKDKIDRLIKMILSNKSEKILLYFSGIILNLCNEGISPYTREEYHEKIKSTPLQKVDIMINMFKFGKEKINQMSKMELLQYPIMYKFLIRLNEIENQDLYIEYIKWIIDLAYIMQCNNVICNHTKTTNEFKFWNIDNEDNRQITEKLNAPDKNWESYLSSNMIEN